MPKELTADVWSNMNAKDKNQFYVEKWMAGQVFRGKVQVGEERRKYLQEKFPREFQPKKNLK